MTRARLSIIAPALCLLTITSVAGSASAECAWVLWPQTKGETLIYDETVSASPTSEGCNRMLRQELGKWTGTDVTLIDTTVYVRSQNKDGSPSISSIRYTCPPDTVDPRGPKGK